MLSRTDHLIALYYCHAVCVVDDERANKLFQDASSGMTLNSNSSVALQTFEVPATKLLRIAFEQTGRHCLPASLSTRPVSPAGGVAPQFAQVPCAHEGASIAECAILLFDDHVSTRYEGLPTLPQAQIACGPARRSILLASRCFGR